MRDAADNMNLAASGSSPSTVRVKNWSVTLRTSSTRVSMLAIEVSTVFFVTTRFDASASAIAMKLQTEDVEIGITREATELADQALAVGNVCFQ